MIKFFEKLKKQGKLKLIETSEEIKKSYIEKSESNLLSAKILLENDKLEESIALTYYSMYNMVLALLFKVGIKCENHTGSILLLRELFDLDNLDIKLAKKERIDKQYYTDFNIVRKDVLDAVSNAEDFNIVILNFISKLNNEEIESYREKFKDLIT